jgi:hypothetical protein
MPYITSAEQGRPDPSQQIQGAAQAFIQQQAMRQQMQQQAAAFPIEQQSRQAAAKESSIRADSIQRTIDLQQKAADLQNQLSDTNLAFQKETDPLKKQQLQQQIEETKGQIQNLAFQGQLLQAQTKNVTGEAAARAFSMAPSTTTPGKLDPYGNQVVTTTTTDPTTGNPVSRDTFEHGRGIPRVAYRQVPGPDGQLMREPGVVQMDDQGNMTVHFASDGQPAQDNSNQRTSTTDALVQQYFDSATGAPKKTWFGQGSTVLPKSPVERAALRDLLQNPSLMKQYGLNPTADLTSALGLGTDKETSPAAPGTGSNSTVNPSTVTSGSGNQDDQSRTGDAGPSGAVKQPNLTAPQDTPPAAGVSAGGTAVKAGADAVPTSPTATAAPIPIASGRSKVGVAGAAGASPVGTVAGASQPTVSGKKGSKFSDLPAGSYFMQNGVRYKKTGPTAAIPAENDASTQTTPATPSTQSPSLPSAQGM